MNRAHRVVGAILALALLAGCSLTGSTVATPTSPPTDLAAALTPTRQPAVATSTPPTPDTAIPRATPTWVPTLPPATAVPAATPSIDLLATMDAVEAEMEELRGLDRTLPITRTLMTRQELTAYLEREMAEDYPPEEVEADVRVLAAFDFVPEDFDLRRLLLDLYSSQILGMYDEEQDTFYIITETPGVAGGKLGLMDRLTFAHEYTHGLQDQYFDLDSFVDEDLHNDDQALARLSLMEGDASLAMTQYLMAHLLELSAEDLAELGGEEIQGDQEVLNAAPPIIRETLEFPYIYGLEFVTRLQERGWEAVDAAFADPPQSTEQILHPEKYFSGDEPTIVALPPLTDTLGTGWSLVEAEVQGEFQLGIYLAQQMDQVAADLASEGWDGDRYALYVNDEAQVLVVATVWDSVADREEFVDAYTRYAEGKYGQAASRTGESEIWWETATQTACLAWEGITAWIVLGPDPATVADLLAVIRP